jgi:ABC-type lipoprotein release transport system permease subunit
VGAIAGFGLMPLLNSLPFVISPLDPLTFIVVPLLLLFTALLASSVPAYHAAGADPKVALRYLA